MSKINVLNSIEVVDFSCLCGECEYILAENNEENRQKLHDAGFTEQQISESIDQREETIDLMFLAFNYTDADWWSKEVGFGYGI